MSSVGKNNVVVREARQGVLEVSAPGKVILHGEHSVVYKKRALALAVDLRTHLTLTPGGNAVTLTFSDVVEQSWPLKDIQDLSTQLECKEDSQGLVELSNQRYQALLDFLGCEGETTNPQNLALLAFLHLYLSILSQPEPMAISTTSQLPTGAGLGSSAAYAVCLSASLLHYFNTHSSNTKLSQTNKVNEPFLEKVCQWAFRCEQIFHGTPSGIDNSVCTYGGAINFKDGACLPLEVPRLKVILVNTRVPRSTKALVAGVRNRRERLPHVIKSILEALDAVADHGLEVLTQLHGAKHEEDSISGYSALNELVDVNQALLSGLGVSHPSLDKLVAVAASHGLHAKLTGAGGGGFGVVVVPPTTCEMTVTTCQKDLEAAGFQIWVTHLGAPGLTFHNQL